MGTTLRIATALLVCVLAGCGSIQEFKQENDAKFGDQHFKTAIGLIELHKLRNSKYPESLTELQFTGDWDQIALHSVEYKKLPDGYELNVTRGWIGAPQLSYPPEFFTGLGIKKSNVKSVRK